MSTIAADDLPAICAELAALLEQKAGVPRGHAILTTSGGAEWSLWLSHYGAGVDKAFSAPTLAEAIADARRWLETDQVADINATLGLTPDGRFAEAA